MLYFAAVTSTEQHESADAGFLRAHDSLFRTVVAAALHRLNALHSATTETAASDFSTQTSRVADFEAWLADAVAPWNQVGLFGRPDGMYTATAAPAETGPEDVRPG